ncbi:MAG: geranyl transferase [Betaproteobacteria bacterium RBG_16_64_9]|nr:MAG: geranyl transferase [Betaproteobacteria bacterium RBG_16_64_9]OGA21588.1 MAG: geranyl transferase [Betaproteobacteria bacterium RIFCSPLOWO2_02_FULL_65_24]OGA78620.1 MAG: geranyl transferase [Betaproteobacteria bacterium RIFCSPLOWO2_12_FULL_66_14]
MGRVQARVESALERALPRADLVPVRLHSAMRYAVLGGGKRVRPLLVHAAGEAAARGEGPEQLLAKLDAAACAVECIHAYSLVHDDLPCMDDDILRRGKPTVHVEYDEATALLVGDSLQSLAFQLLTERVLAEPAKQLEMLRILAQAVGSRGMAGGQAIDLASIGQTLSLPELEFMHIHKTGALIRASVALGALCADRLSEAQLGALDRYAKCIGLAFQVVDDALDSESTTATLGKTAGKDEADNKPTYVKALGLSDAKALARELRAQAHEAIAPFGASARRLSELADFIVLRKF